MQATQISRSVDPSLYRITINSGIRSSKVLLNVAEECYTAGVSSREVSKTFNLFGTGAMS